MIMGVTLVSRSLVGAGGAGACSEALVGSAERVDSEVEAPSEGMDAASSTESFEGARSAARVPWTFRGCRSGREGVRQNLSKHELKWKSKERSSKRTGNRYTRIQFNLLGSTPKPVPPPPTAAALACSSSPVAPSPAAPPPSPGSLASGTAPSSVDPSLDPASSVGAARAGPSCPAGGNPLYSLKALTRSTWRSARNASKLPSSRGTTGSVAAAAASAPAPTGMVAVVEFDPPPADPVGLMFVDM